MGGDPDCRGDERLSTHTIYQVPKRKYVCMSPEGILTHIAAEAMATKAGYNSRNAVTIGDAAYSYEGSAQDSFYSSKKLDISQGKIVADYTRNKEFQGISFDLDGGGIILSHALNILHDSVKHRLGYPTDRNQCHHNQLHGLDLAGLSGHLDCRIVGSIAEKALIAALTCDGMATLGKFRIAPTESMMYPYEDFSRSLIPHLSQDERKGKHVYDGLRSNIKSHNHFTLGRLEHGLGKLKKFDVLPILSNYEGAISECPDIAENGGNVLARQMIEMVGTNFNNGLVKHVDTLESIINSKSK